MSNFMISRIKVKDFAEWKGSYEAHKHARDAAGMTEKYLLQDVDDPDMVTILFEVEDIIRAQEFGHSDDLIEAMQKAGVVGEPDLYYLTD